MKLLFFKKMKNGGWMGGRLFWPLRPEVKKVLS